MSETPQNEQKHYIDVDHPNKGKIKVQAYKDSDGEDYFSMMNAELYLGVSKYWLYQQIAKRETTNPDEAIRFTFGDGAAIYIPKKILDELPRKKTAPEPNNKSTPRPFEGRRAKRHSD